jgi:hypothetical protein
MGLDKTAPCVDLPTFQRDCAPLCSPELFPQGIVKHVAFVVQ